jgi:hypothetical protein
MNGKKARDIRNENNDKLKLMTEEEDHQKVAEDMAKSIAKMYEDRDKKALGAREHLVSQLQVTANKYRTATGVMSALQVVRDVMGEYELELIGILGQARDAARAMVKVTTGMAEKAQGLDPEEMDQLCDGFYDADFVDDDKEPSAMEVVKELMQLQLCQNVGPAAQDVADFCKTADEEIEKARKDLQEYCGKNGLDFDAVCAEHPEE